MGPSCMWGNRNQGSPFLFCCSPGPLTGVLGGTSGSSPPTWTLLGSQAALLRTSRFPVSSRLCSAFNCQEVAGLWMEALHSTHTHTQTHTHTHTHTRKHTHIHIPHIYTHTYTYKHIHIHTYTHTHKHIQYISCTHILMHTHVYTHTYMHTHIYHTHTYMHTHIYHTHTHTHNHAYTYLYVQHMDTQYTNIHIYKYTHTRIYHTIHIYTYTHIHAHTHTHTHTHCHGIMSWVQAGTPLLTLPTSCAPGCLWLR